MKKVLSILLSLAMLCSITAGLGFDAFADSSTGTCGENLTYTFTQENGVGVLTISGTGAMTSYTPTTSPFANRTDINRVVIEPGVTSVGAYAFYCCEGLTEVEILNGNMANIGPCAFSQCQNIESILFESTDNIRMESTAFYNATVKNVVYVRATKATIRDNNDGLENANHYYAPESYNGSCGVNDKVTYSYSYNNKIGLLTISGTWYMKYFENQDDSVFKSLYITHVIIKSGVLNVSQYAFYGAPFLKSVSFADSVARIDNYAFANSGLGTLTLGNGITSIGEKAFYNCKKLTAVTVPDNVVTYGNYAFDSCTKMTRVNIKSLEKWCSSTFEADTNLLEYAKNLYLNGTLIEDLVIPDGITTIGKGAFRYAACIKTISIADSVTSIGSYAFSNCTGLTNIDIPSGVTQIPAYMFQYCTSLTDVTIPDHVTGIGSAAFRRCKNLKSITIPDSVTKINSYAFMNCEALTDITLSGGLTGISSEMFSNCTSLSNITIPNGVTSIGDQAFYNCTALENICIPDSVVTIGEKTFQNCASIKYVEIGSGITTVKSTAFAADMNALEYVKIFSHDFDDFENVLMYMPSTATLWAYDDTNGQTYCSMFGINYQSLDDLDCQNGRHTYVLSSTVDATCEEAGKKVYTCSRCGAVREDTIDALGHTAVTDAGTAPTCTAVGWTEGSHCSVCGTVLQAPSQIPATGHLYNAVVTAPTAESGGYTTYTCTRCGFSYISSYTAPVGDGSGNESNFEEPDFDTYDALMALVSTYHESDYSAESYAAFAAFCDVYGNLKDEAVTQNEIDRAVAEILSCIYDLVPYLDVKTVCLHGSVTIDGAAQSTARALRGTDVLLLATADDGYTFKGWYDDDTSRLISTDAAYTLRLSSNTTLQAVFVKTGNVALTFKSASGQVVKTVEKTADAWAQVTDLADLLPAVPYSFGKTNGRWLYDNDAALAALAAGGDYEILPAYDDDEKEHNRPSAELADEAPALALTYEMDADNNVASFLLAVSVPADCAVEEIGTAFCYKNAESFDPTQYVVTVNSHTLTSKFGASSDDGIYITNFQKFSSRYNWAARGYVIYRDKDGVRKTAYSNQINIVNRQQVSI